MHTLCLSFHGFSCGLRCSVTCLNRPPHLQFDSSSMWVLNINEMDSISHSWRLWHLATSPPPPPPPPTGLSEPPSPICGPRSGFFILFKDYSRLLLSPKGHLGCAVEMCWLSSIFEGGLSVFLIHWWHGSLHMKLRCGFQWTWGEHIYKLNPEPMGPVGKYLPWKALK